MANFEPLAVKSPAKRRRKADVLIARLVLVVAGLASVGALAVSAIAPELANRAVEAAQKQTKLQAAAQGLDGALAMQRNRDMALEITAALDQASVAAARARTAGDQGRAVLRETLALIARRPDLVVRSRTPQGDVYEGEIEAGRPQGYGLVRRASGGVFASYFIDGESRGAAAFCAQAECRGDVYFGDYRNDQPTGFGEGVAARGQYRGEFKDGVPDGYGEYAYPGGETYRGGFVAGVRQGFGVLTLPDGTVQAGFWSANQLRIPAPPPQAAPQPAQSAQSAPNPDAAPAKAP